MNIYIGNLAETVTDDDLYVAFKAHGQVRTANVVRDKFSFASRGFGFIDMPNKPEAQKAIDALNGSEIQGKKVTVNEARPREERPRGGKGGGFRSGGGGGGGNRRW